MPGTPKPVFAVLSLCEVCPGGFEPGTPCSGCVKYCGERELQVYIARKMRAVKTTKRTKEVVRRDLKTGASILIMLRAVFKVPQD